MVTKDTFVNSDEIKENYIVSSLVRGFEILSTFTPKRPALKVSEIAESTGLDQATVFRFVYTLEKLGYLVRDEETKRYHQSIRMLTLSLPARLGSPVRDVALPTILKLSEKLKENITLSLLDGVGATTIAIAEIPGKLIFSTNIGYRSPGYCTAKGKVLLAYQPIENWDRLISQIEFIQYTDNTILDPEDFRQELTKTRQQGYAIDDGEHISNVGSIAAPIFNYHKDVVAAIDITDFSMEILSEEKKGINIQELIKTAGIISKDMGHIF